VKVHLYDKYRPTLLLPKTASLANYLVTRRQEAGILAAGTFPSLHGLLAVLKCFQKRSAIHTNIYKAELFTYNSWIIVNKARRHQYTMYPLNREPNAAVPVHFHDFGY